MDIQYENLLGVPFDFGNSDCIDFVIRLYKQNFDINITNYARPNDWNADHIDIIGLSYEREGFEKVEGWTLKNLHPGDLLAMAIGTSKANHLAVYVGGNTIAHHKVGSLSSSEVLRDFWRNSICYVLRHPDVPYEETVQPVINIQELIDARYKVQPQAQAEES